MTAVDHNSPATQSYLGILQGVISRMAANSASSKTWCIALVSAVVVIIADKEKPDFVWISIIPIVLFFFLDAYYLGLEQQVRELYNGFVRRLHAGEATLEDTFVVRPSEGLVDTLSATGSAAMSISVWPFYGLLGLMLIVIKAWIL
jgi:hypothetical protein